MAGNKVNSKNKGKGSKSATPANDESEELDSAMLRKPIRTSITGFAQARKIFDVASEELKKLLTKECDLLYECKVCRNIFRSLANFISHKRIYCKETFSSSLHSEFMKASSAAVELSKIKQIERGYQEYIKNKETLETITEEDEEDRIPLTKDITDIVERLTKARGIKNNEEDNQVVLEKIPNSSVAVFQNLTTEDKRSDKMRAEVQELECMLSQDQAVMQGDGKFTVVSSTDDKRQTDSVIQISDDDDTTNADSHALKCKICDLPFSTLKTLKFHMKYKHVESRLVYPCPECLEVFCTSWSVYRHLFKVHRKTAAQIRRLRESIQGKAFRMNNPPAYYEKRKNSMRPAAQPAMSREEQMDQDNQAWMDNMECDGEAARCGGCGRAFERRAALVAHTQTCQERSRALRRPEGKRIEIQIRRDYNKGPSIAVMKATGIQGKTATNEDTTNSNKNADDENIDENDDDVEDTAEDAAVDEDPKSEDSNEDSPENIDVVGNKDDSNNDVDTKPSFYLLHAIQTEQSNLAAFKRRIKPHVDYNTLLCKKCDAIQTSATELFVHMAGHYKWKRYACKLCNFKHYNFEKLPEHVQVIHKLKGDSDFYHSTVKAIDGREALMLSKCLLKSTFDDANDTNEESPESGRPSRCSSDSSRLSDDSSSGSHMKVAGSRKRKAIPNKAAIKKKKEGSNDEEHNTKNGDVSMDKVLNAIIGGGTPASVKVFDEYSSDIDDTEDKAPNRDLAKHSTASRRRPVRNKTKRKNEDFEYDLSNILKTEAQGYRESQQTVTKLQPVTTKSNQPKKKNTLDIVSQIRPLDNNQILHNFYGALAILSKKAVENATAHMKTANFAVYSIPKERVPPNIFAKPMTPKVTKISPKKDAITSNDTMIAAQNKMMHTETSSKSEDEVSRVNVAEQINKDKDNTVKSDETSSPVDPTSEVLLCNEPSEEKNKTDTQEPVINDSHAKRATNAADLNLPAIYPMTIRRQSLEIMKPIIKQNITDFTKAGMKTKILVIKPIKNKDGTRRAFNAPLKFQTIKMKDKGASNDDQAVLVKVPKVTCTNVSEKPTQTSCNTVASLTKIGTNDENYDIETSKELTAHTISTVSNLIRSSEADTTSPAANAEIQQSEVKKNPDDINKPKCDSNKPENIDNVVNKEVVLNRE